MKLIGGESLEGPVDALQNAITFNYYANSNFTKEGMYARPSQEADNQVAYNNGVVVKQKEAQINEANNQAVKEATEGIQRLLITGALK
jgi:hypothetical protein